jgi:hypothetical protein
MCGTRLQFQLYCLCASSAQMSSVVAVWLRLKARLAFSQWPVVFTGDSKLDGDRHWGHHTECTYRMIY